MSEYRVACDDMWPFSITIWYEDEQIAQMMPLYCSTMQNSFEECMAGKYIDNKDKQEAVKRNTRILNHAIALTEGIMNKVVDKVYVCLITREECEAAIDRLGNRMNLLLED